MQRFLTVGQLSAPPFDPSHMLSAISSAIYYKRTHVYNWFHTFQEDGAQIFNLFCTYLGLCAYDDFYSAGKVRKRPLKSANAQLSSLTGGTVSQHAIMGRGLSVHDAAA